MIIHTMAHTSSAEEFDRSVLCGGQVSCTPPDVSQIFALRRLNVVCWGKQVKNGKIYCFLLEYSNPYAGL